MDEKGQMLVFSTRKRPKRLNILGDLRFRDGLDKSFYDGNRVYAFRLGPEVCDDTMTQDRDSDLVDILNRDRVSSVHSGEGFSPEDEVEPGAGTGAPVNHLLDDGGSLGIYRATGADEPGNIPDDVGGGLDLFDDGLDGEEVPGRENLPETGQRASADLGYDFFLFVRGGVFDVNLEHKAVELGLREGIGSFLFDGVLGGDDKEGVGQGIGFLADCYLVLLHRLKQSGLGLGGRPVYLVSEYQVCKNRPWEESKLASCSRLVKDIGSGYVTWHQVRGELNSLEGEVEEFTESPCKKGLGQSRNSDQQCMTAGEEAGEYLADDLLLPYDRTAQFGGDFGPMTARPSSEVISVICW